MTGEQLIDSQGNEDHNSRELNISGISNLSDPSDILDDHGENDFPLRSEPDNNRAFFEAHTLTPPTKKQQTLNSDASFEESNSKDRADSLSLEQEPSQSFHFSQWKKDQMAKCKEIQDRDFTEYSFYNHAGSITSAGRECCHKKTTAMSEKHPLRRHPLSLHNGQNNRLRSAPKYKRKLILQRLHLRHHSILVNKVIL